MISISIYLHICMSIYMYVYIYIYVYIFIYIHSQGFLTTHKVAAKRLVEHDSKGPPVDGLGVALTLDDLQSDRDFSLGNGSQGNPIRPIRDY